MHSRSVDSRSHGAWLRFVGLRHFGQGAALSTAARSFPLAAPKRQLAMRRMRPPRHRGRRPCRRAGDGCPRVAAGLLQRERLEWVGAFHRAGHVNGFVANALALFAPEASARRARISMQSRRPARQSNCSVPVQGAAHRCRSPPSPGTRPLADCCSTPVPPGQNRALAPKSSQNAVRLLDVDQRFGLGNGPAIMLSDRLRRCRDRGPQRPFVKDGFCR